MTGYISYNPHLTESAKLLRKNETLSEKIIWSKLLKNRNLKGYKFTRQKPIDHYVLDFYCARLMLGIEIDGKIHKQLAERDLERTLDLNVVGVKIVRYTNEEVLHSLNEVHRDLLKQIKIREKELLKMPRHC